MVPRPRGGAIARAAPWVVAGALVAPPARAQDRLTFSAGRVEADAALTDVTLEKDVDVRYGRYRLRGDRLRVRGGAGEVRFDGDAHLALCPCADPPLTFGAAGGRFQPPGDLFLRAPRIEIGGRPVFALPFLWLRAPDQVGLLPPILALRGPDGLLLGGGVHLPLRAAGGEVRAIDLSAAGFSAGGMEMGAAVRTPEGRARAVVDLVHGTRVVLDARGAAPDRGGPLALAWDLDAIRGDRARDATVELGAAARPFDTGAAEASLRGGAGGAGIVAGGGVVLRALRGEGPIVLGPRASLAAGGPIGRVGSWSADAGAAALANATASGATPIARAAAAAEIDERLGPVALRAMSAARARYAGTMDAGAAREEAIAARAELSLPIVRTFAAGGGPPIAHWITPTLLLRGALADVRGDFFAPIDGQIPPASWIAAAGITTAVGRYAGPALRLDARAGASGNAAGDVQPLLHAHLGADGRLAAVAVDAAAIGAPRDRADLPRGYSLVARVHLGGDMLPGLRIDAGVQGGAGAGRARAIASGAWAALPGDELAYLAQPGITTGAEIFVPWSRAVRTTARADVDLTAGSILAVRGVAEYHHSCGCLGVILMGAHRMGRGGIDLTATVDVVPAALR